MKREKKREREKKKQKKKTNREKTNKQTTVIDSFSSSFYKLIYSYNRRALDDILKQLSFIPFSHNSLCTAEQNQRSLQRNKTEITSTLKRNVL